MSTAFSAVSETIERNAELNRHAAEQASEARRPAEEAQQRAAAPDTPSQDDLLPGNQRQ